MDLNALVDNYAEAIRSRDPKAVAGLYAEDVELLVHGLGDADSAWRSKRQSGSAGVEAEYRGFFELVDEFQVEYTDRIIDLQQRAVAVIVRIQGINADGSAFDMANALHLFYDAQGKITRMLNWYGQAV